MIGRVDTYSPKKRYGHISGDDGRRYFVHETEVRTMSKSLDAGCTVEFIPAMTQRGRQAENVRLL